RGTGQRRCKGKAHFQRRENCWWYFPAGVLALRTSSWWHSHGYRHRAGLPIRSPFYDCIHLVDGNVGLSAVSVACQVGEPGYLCWSLCNCAFPHVLPNCRILRCRNPGFTAPTQVNVWSSDSWDNVLLRFDSC